VLERIYQTVVPTFQYFLDLVPCRTGCPVRTNAGAYVQAIAQGDTARGYDVARAPNPLASSCARICAHPCESKCRRGVIDQPISIRALKRVVTERHGVEKSLSAPWVPVRLDVAARKGKVPARVAVVGAGPAGVSCAHDLALLGYRVTIFEAAPVAGGMLYQGVPEYRLPRDLIRAEVDQVLSMGVELRLSSRLGRDFTVYVDPMGAPGQTNARNYGSDYYVVISPGPGSGSPVRVVLRPPYAWSAARLPPAHG